MACRSVSDASTLSNAPTKLQRWLDVVAYLAARRLPVSTEELWENVPAYAGGLEDATEKARVRLPSFPLAT